MNSLRKILPVFMLSLLFVAVAAQAGVGKELHQTFEKKKMIDINTVSGDCVIIKGSTDEIIVDLKYKYSPRDSYEPIIEERGNRLEIGEDFWGRNSSGYSTWTITVPDDVRIRFSSASGDFRGKELSNEISVDVASGDILLEGCELDVRLETASGDIDLANCSGEIRGSTASGDVTIESCKGDFDLGTASGDVEIIDCEGLFEISTASGSIEAEGVVLEDVSEFHTASGRVYVQLAKSAEHDLSLESASGRVVLNYGGNPVKGVFEFVSKAHRGRIVAPFDFEHEEEFRRWGDRYVRKSFQVGDGGPEIFLATASGKATLEEK